MSGRSSARELIAAALVLSACKHAKKPEADPAKVVAIANHMLRTVPPPAAVPDCRLDQLDGITLTQRTLLEIAGKPVGDAPELAAWINPPAFDAPAARVLADPKADRTAARQAAAQVLAAPSLVVYRVDMVNSPLALGVKDPKTGTLGARVIRYDLTGEPTCAIIYSFQDDPKVATWAIAKSDRAIVDPAIAKAMREDLAKQYLLRAPRRGSAAAGSGSAR